MTNPMFPAVSDNDDENFPGNDRLRELLGIAGPRAEEQSMVSALAEIAATVRATRVIARGLDAVTQHMKDHCRGLSEHEEKIADLLKRVEQLEAARTPAAV